MVYYVTRLSEKKKVHAHCQIVYRSDYTTLDMLEIQKSGIRQMSLDFFFTCPESHRRPHHSCWTSAASVPPLPYYWNYCPWRIPSFERQESHRSQHTYPPYYITKSLFCRQPRRGALRELLSEIWENPLFRENFVYYFFGSRNRKWKIKRHLLLYFDPDEIWWDECPPPDGGQRSVKNNVYYFHIKNSGNVLKINIKGQNN